MQASRIAGFALIAIGALLIIGCLVLDGDEIGLCMVVIIGFCLILFGASLAEKQSVRISPLG